VAIMLVEQNVRMALELALDFEKVKTASQCKIG
jgi:ABC-type branched-subunit amino acid transport system ATPase component